MNAEEISCSEGSTWASKGRYNISYLFDAASITFELIGVEVSFPYFQMYTIRFKTLVCYLANGLYIVTTYCAKF